MNQIISKAIILKRLNYGEADRILTVITPDYGKLRLMARGVRKVKSKLAGGIELFSVSDITFIRGRGEIGTLISTRLETHYDEIVKNIDRTMLGYELIKQLDRATEDHPEPSYFSLLLEAFQALNDPAIANDLISAWFAAQLLQLGGHAPNLRTDTKGAALESTKSYMFSLADMAFTPSEHGNFTSNSIKLLRLLFGGHAPKNLVQIHDGAQMAASLSPLIQSMRIQHIRV